MRVKVRLFAQLRDLAGSSDLDCVLGPAPKGDTEAGTAPEAGRAPKAETVAEPVAETVAVTKAETETERGAAEAMAPSVSVQDVWRAVVRDHPALGSFTRAMSTAVNLEYARLDSPVRDGDEVAFLPPVSGG